jgi:hypothetical protein
MKPSAHKAISQSIARTWVFKQIDSFSIELWQTAYESQRMFDESFLVFNLDIFD